MSTTIRTAGFTDIEADTTDIVRRVKLIAVCMLYKIGELAISYDDLNAAYDESGLAGLFGDKFRRSPRSPRDVARTAVKTGAFKKCTLTLPDETVTHDGFLSVTLVVQDERELVWVMKENWPDSLELDVPDRKVCTIRYYEPSPGVAPHRLTVDRVCAMSEAAEQAIDKIQKAYAVFLDHYNGGHVRQTMSNIIDTLNPVPYRGTKGDGAYAVHPKHLPVVRALRKFVGEVSARAKKSTGDLDCSFRVTKIDDEVDDDKNDLLTDLMAHIDRKSADMSSEIRERLASGEGITPTESSRMTAELSQLETMAKEFDELLGLAAGDISKKVAATRIAVRKAWRAEVAPEVVEEDVSAIPTESLIPVTPRAGDDQIDLFQNQNAPIGDVA